MQLKRRKYYLSLRFLNAFAYVNEFFIVNHADVSPGEDYFGVLQAAAADAASASADGPKFDRNDYQNHRCDILSPPSSYLNITSVVLDEFVAWGHQDTNESLFSTVMGVEDEDDEDYLLFTAVAKWFHPSSASSSSASKLDEKVLIAITAAVIVAAAANAAVWT